jgi:antirestriction protein
LFINGIWTVIIACFDCHAATLNCQRLQAQNKEVASWCDRTYWDLTPKEIQLAALRGAKKS